ncbi:MAG: phosphatase PAP2 family protein [Candidatus Dojkabacteria bacterium]
MSRIADPESLTAKVISIISNPVLFLVGSFLLGNLQIVRANPQITVIFFTVGGFFPFILYIHYLWIHKKHIFEYTAVPREKRDNLYLAAIISFALVVLMSVYSGISYFWVYSGMLFVVLFTSYYLLNKYIDKASFHTGIFAFGVLYLTNRVSVAFAILLILVPFVGWSRVYLHKHTWFQLMLGTVIGMFLAILSWTF